VTGGGAVVPRRRYADDREQPLADGDRLADGRRTAREAALPIAIADYGGRRRRRHHIVGRGEQSAGGGFEAEQAVVAAGDEIGGDELLFAVDDHRLAGDHLSERSRNGFHVVAELLEQGKGDDAWTTVEKACDLDEPVRFADRQRAQHHRVDQREDGGVGADAERKGQDRDGSEPWRPSQRAHRVTQIGCEIVEPASAHVADCLLDLRHVAEFEKGTPLGFLPAHTLGEIVLDQPIAMESQFVGDARIMMPAEPHGSLRGSEDAGDRSGQPIPVGALLVELLTAEPGERIEAGLASSVGRGPFSCEPAALFEAMERGIERALLDLQDVAGHLLQALRDGVAVDRAEGDDFQDEDVERALEQVGFGGVARHAKTFYI
jgi:hypothetical protein